MKGNVMVSMLVVLSMILLMVKPGQAINCVQVNGYLSPCISYLTTGGNPTPKCCDGVKSIKNSTSTSEDRRAACNCIKAAANRYPVITEDTASSLPEKCGVELNIPISWRTNCNNIY